MPSNIQWTDETLNAIRGMPHVGIDYCERISPGCEHCYASREVVRHEGKPYPSVGEGVRPAPIMLRRDVLEQPLRWTKPRMIFVCSMSDLFGEWVYPEIWRRHFDVMTKATQHTYQLLTKRPVRMAEAVADYFGADQVPAHIWCGVSVELDRYIWRAHKLGDINAAVRFISAEPLLGPLPGLPLEVRCMVCMVCGGSGSVPVYENGIVVGGKACPGCYDETMGGTGRVKKIHWVIVGGESGGPAERSLVLRQSEQVRGEPRTGWYEPRPEALRWVVDIEQQCDRSGVAFWFKQWGGPTPKAGGNEISGRVRNEFPKVSHG